MIIWRVDYLGLAIVVGAVSMVVHEVDDIGGSCPSSRPPAEEKGDLLDR